MPKGKEAPHRKGISRNVFSVRRHPRWTYRDKVEGYINNAITVGTSTVPHLVLYDGNGEARVTLSYGVDGGIRLIDSIQRERTKGSYSVADRTGYTYWDPKKEGTASDALKAELGGVHPNEFLLSEFIRRHRSAIRDGRRTVYLMARPGFPERELYGPLIDRFFVKRPVVEEVFGRRQKVHRLNLNRKRVKALLGLD